ncbi:NAD(P)-dependent oxidoreductase [Candidatus Woesearchaeota archaeon]|nr:NAD(P)-dependent oxidoreductase [Candidatus Woesearchaeota archaeon]
MKIFVTGAAGSIGKNLAKSSGGKRLDFRDALEKTVE